MAGDLPHGEPPGAGAGPLLLAPEHLLEGDLAPPQVARIPHARVPLQLGQRWLDARGEDGVHHELFVHESLPAVPVALRHLEVPIVGDLSSNGVDFLGFPLLTMRCDA